MAQGSSPSDAWRETFWALVLLVLAPSPAHAYVDPGSGTLLLQVQVLVAALVAALVGGLVTAHQPTAALTTAVHDLVPVLLAGGRAGSEAFATWLRARAGRD